MAWKVPVSIYIVKAEHWTGCGHECAAAATKYIIYACDAWASKAKQILLLLVSLYFLVWPLRQIECSIPVIIYSVLNKLSLLCGAKFVCLRRYLPMYLLYFADGLCKCACVQSSKKKIKKSTARCSTSIGQMAISWKVEQRRKVTKFTTNGRSMRNINDNQKQHKTLRQWCLVWLFLQLFVWYTFSLLNDKWAHKQKQTSCVPPGDNVGKAVCRLWVEGLLCSAYVTSPQPCDHFRCNKLPTRKGIVFFPVLSLESLIFSSYWSISYYIIWKL